ncbi:MAG: hypothetical protein HC786_13440 [Richelia sp. CSU_2_1]|nr:hypothetical protein [Microcoleus sp. SM1_3_4]NJR23085.1 hypothetical protein [Richelia sp. CSU_2_1]
MLVNKLPYQTAQNEGKAVDFHWGIFAIALARKTSSKFGRSYGNARTSSSFVVCEPAESYLKVMKIKLAIEFDPAASVNQSIEENYDLIERIAQTQKIEQSFAELHRFLEELEHEVRSELHRSKTVDS